MTTTVSKLTRINLVLALAAALVVVPGQVPRLTVSAQGGPLPGQPGVVAAYGFEEGTGSTTADATGNGNSGTLAGATWSTAGRFGRALTFNGTNSRVNIPDAGILDLTIGMTVEAWVNPAVLNDWHSAVIKETPNGLAYALYADNAAKSAGWINVADTEVGVAGPATLALNTWTHLATTYDGTMLRVYVNGIQAASRATTGTLTTSGSPLRIGGNAVWGEYFNGRIDEVRIYGRALSVSEILSDMNTPVAQADETAPAVSLVSPPGGGTNVPGSTNVTATFSEAMAASTISGATFELRNASNQLVPATVTYNATTFAATLDPTADLIGSATYTATVRGGATGPRATDAAGNALASNIVWSFTVAAGDTTAPTVSGVAPPAGATNVAGSTTVTAIFSETMTASTIDSSTFELRDAANQIVPATVSYNVATLTATVDPTTDLTPGAVYTATLRGGASDPRVKDAAGNALAASAVWSFTTAAAAACPCSIWGPTDTPATPDFNDSGSVELGVKFRADRDGVVTGVRFYKGNGNTGTHVGSLWTAAGVLRGSVTFTGETTSGWQHANFSTPLAITANTVYVVSYFAPVGHYAINAGFFSTSVDRGPLHALSNATGANGLFVYTTTPGTFPTQSFNAGNYWVDLVYVDGGDTMPPSVSSQSPAAGATAVATSTAVTATFSEGIDVTTLTGSTFELRTPASTVVAATLSYDAASRTATLVPSAPLNASTVYTATVRGGTTDPRVKDPAGNALATSTVWSFTTAGPAPVVSGTSPAAGANGIALSSAVSATFSQAIDPATITAGTFELRNPANALVAATVSYDAASQTATLVPSGALTASTVYTATVRGGTTDPRVKNPAGTALAANVVWSFTTAAPPVVSSVSPSAGATNIGPSASVTATFSVAVNPATVTTSTFELRTPTNALVPATVSYDAASRTATLVPSAALSQSTTYTATVRGGATDPRVTSTAGAALAANVVWSFTTAAPPGSTSYTIWSPATTPATANAADGSAVEVGVKFQADRAGSLTAIRFYKGPTNTGTHVGSVWTAAGVLLGSVTFTGETASGWQQATFAAPIAISANTTYIASYHAPVGRYSVNGSFFGSAVDNPPLHALANSTSANGVYRYSSTPGAFPNLSYNSSNYWVDVVFVDGGGSDSTPPLVSTSAPASGATNVSTWPSVTATFNENIDPSTVTTGTFELRTPANVVVVSAVSYDAATRTATLQPSAPLAASTVHTATVRGGATDPRVKDLAGNPLASNTTWSFTTTAVPANDGPGGPVLVIASTANPFGRYYGEILRNEGLNLFTVTDISLVTASTLNAYDVVILGEMPLTAGQVTMFTTWVTAGGNLIAMRPDKQLAGLLGLTAGTGTRANQYLLMDTAGAAAGLVDQTIQYHGAADLYTLNGATAVATLYSTATTPTTNPAVTLRTVGGSGGQAAAFTFDLARSIAQTRQGNPAWSGQERDTAAPIRSDDLFFGPAPSDPQPDWIDFNKIAIPQADEQQRLLANLILQMSTDRKPLPRLWYLPRGLKAAVVMTGDDHAAGATAGRWDTYIAASPAGCSVADWECVRGTSYIYPSAPLTSAQAASYNAQGFEVALHVTTNCADYTPAQFETFITNQLAAFTAKYSSLPPSVTNRTHCIAFADYVSQPKIELSHGIRLDTNYYYWPAQWVLDRPGFFTGSGMPMRFADVDGTTIDVYQAATQITDESGQTYQYTIDSLLDRALGPEGYYAVVTANMHTDSNPHAGSAAIVASAQGRGVPIVTAKQMLTWLDGRNASSFSSINWTGGTLTFTVVQGTGANGLQAMLPATSTAGQLATLSRAGSAVPFTIQTIKGVPYGLFTAAAGAYTAVYTTTPDTLITASPAAASPSTSASFSLASMPAGATFQCALDGAAFSACTSPRTYSGLSTGSHTFQARAVNAAGTDASPASFSWTVYTPTTVAPTAAVVLTGTLLSGTPSSLSADDNSYYQVNSTTSGTRTSSWYGSFTAPNEMRALSISYTGRYSQTGCTQTVEIWRWSDSMWIALDTRTVGTTEVPITSLAPAGGLADYVNGTSGSGELRVRVRATRSGTTNFTAQGDQISITYGQ